MEILRVEIPKYIRKVQLSLKQRPVYFEWNGVSITGKRTNIPRKWLKSKMFTQAKYIKIEDFKDNYVIGEFKDKKLIQVYRNTTSLPNPNQLLLTKNNFRLCVKNIEVNVEEKVINTYDLVLCNPKTVNTPKNYLIKGQDFYNSKIREFQRGVVMDEIKKCFRPYLESLPVIESYPIRIACEIRDTIKNFYDSRENASSNWDVDNRAYPYLKAFPDLLQELGKIKNDNVLHITQPPSAIFYPIDNHEDRSLTFIITKDERDIIKNNKTYQDFHKVVTETTSTGDIQQIYDEKSDTLSKVIKEDKPF